MEVVGFEGDRPGCPISYGTAAVKLDDGSVLNTITRRHTSPPEWDYCVDEGYVTAVGPLPIPADRKAIVDTKCMLMRLEMPVDAAPRAVERWRSAAVYTWDTPSGIFMLFATFPSLIDASRIALPDLRASTHPSAARTLDVLECAMFGRIRW